MSGWPGLCRYSYGNRHLQHSLSCASCAASVVWKPVTGWKKNRKNYLARTNKVPVSKEPT